MAASIVRPDACTAPGGVRASALPVTPYGSSVSKRRDDMKKQRSQDSDPELSKPRDPATHRGRRPTAPVLCCHSCCCCSRRWICGGSSGSRSPGSTRSWEGPGFSSWQWVLRAGRGRGPEREPGFQCQENPGWGEDTGPWGRRAHLRKCVCSRMQGCVRVYTCVCITPLCARVGTRARVLSACMHTCVHVCAFSVLVVQHTGGF